MIIALISDVHANLTALEAVLTSAQGLGAEAIWNAGDFVGYGPDPNEVVSRLRNLDALHVAGNYDRKVLRVPELMQKWMTDGLTLRHRAFIWAYQTLTEENRQWLANLPDRCRFDREGFPILLTHGSPESISEHLDTRTSFERLVELSKLTDAKLIVTGHSHKPYSRQIRNTWFINPGSVGRSDDGDPRASYAILHLSPGQVSVDLMRVPYNTSAVADRLVAQNQPLQFKEMFLRGVSLSQVLQEEAQ